MKGFAARLRAWIDARSLRERLILLSLLLGLGAAVFDGLVLTPHLEQRRQLASELTAARHSITDTQQKMSEMLVLARQNPVEIQRGRLRQLLDRQQRLRGEVEQLSQRLVSPRAMTTLLQALLTVQGDLVLLRMQNQAPIQVFGEAVENPEVESWRLYKHVTEVELEGSYLATMKFLQQLEDLPWTLFWENLSFQVDEHPLGRVRLRFATLSLDSAWIGV